MVFDSKGSCNICVNLWRSSHAGLGLGCTAAERRYTAGIEATLTASQGCLLVWSITDIPILQEIPLSIYYGPVVLRSLLLFKRQVHVWSIAVSVTVTRKMNSKYSSLATHAVQWRQQHSRMTWVILAVCSLFLVTFLFHDEALDRYYAEDQDGLMLKELPPLETANNHSGDDSIDISPKDLRRAVNRSEQLWKNNVKKRRAFIEAQGGLATIREFADKAHGWGQSFTLVSTELLVSNDSALYILISSTDLPHSGEH